MLDLEFITWVLNYYYYYYYQVARWCSGYRARLTTKWSWVIWKHYNTRSPSSEIIKLRVCDFAVLVGGGRLGILSNPVRVSEVCASGTSFKRPAMIHAIHWRVKQALYIIIVIKHQPPVPCSLLWVRILIAAGSKFYVIFVLQSNHSEP